MNFIHPEYADYLNSSDKARIDQDWYAYSVLYYWFVTKYDPFGEGTLFAKQKFERIYRMEEIILNQSPEVDIAKWKRDFIRRALGRLDSDVMNFIRAFIDRDNSLQAPDFLLTKFHSNNVIICKAIPPDNEERGRPKNMRCGFKQLTGFDTCGYCEITFQ